MKKTIVWSGVLLAAASLCGCGQKEAVHVSEDHAADEISAVEIQNDAWLLEILAAPDGDVHVDLDGKMDKKAEKPRVVLKDGVLQVMMGREEKAGISQFAFGKEGRAAVYIPEGMDAPVTVTNGAGDLKIDGLTVPELAMENTSGYLDLTKVSAERLSISSKEGDVRLSAGTVGDLKIDTSSGYVTLKDVETENVSVACGSGEISLFGLKEGTDAEVSTGSGDISIGYERGPGDLSFEIASGSEDISVKWENVSYTTDTPACKKGMVGDGRGRLRVDSDSGTVVVR